MYESTRDHHDGRIDVYELVPCAQRKSKPLTVERLAPAQVHSTDGELGRDQG